MNDAFGLLIRRMGEAVCAGDFQGAAECFSAEGVYDDDFYGRFAGRAEIARLFAERFHRDGENFRWSFHEPVSDGATGYARYLFSWNSKLPGAGGRRAVFEGVSICRLEGPLIAHYREVAATQTARRMMGFPAERLAKLIGRETERLLSRPEVSAHLD
jgi:hypothetical protein